MSRSETAGGGLGDMTVAHKVLICMDSSWGTTRLKSVRIGGRQCAYALPTVRQDAKGTYVATRVATPAQCSSVLRAPVEWRPTSHRSGVRRRTSTDASVHSPTFGTQASGSLSGSPTGEEQQILVDDRGCQGSSSQRGCATVDDGGRYATNF